MLDKRVLPAAALAAMIAVSAAPAAFAAGVSSTSESSGAACPGVSLSGTDVNGGCHMHITGEHEFRKHVFGVETHITNCAIESAVRINGSGSGFYLEQILTGPTCSRQAVKVGGEAVPWPFSDSEVSGGILRTVNFAIEPVGGGTDETCEIDLPINPRAQSHKWEIGRATIEFSSHGISGFRCEIVGHQLTETPGTHDGENEVGIEYFHV
jgi:hypothetical protein